MAVKIRLTRKGRKNLPFYRIGAYDIRTKRDGKCIEYLGTYDPTQVEDEKKYNVKKERMEYWLSVGAQTSDMVKQIIKKSGIRRE